MKRRGPVEMDAEATAGPKEEFQVTFDVSKISGSGGMLIGKYFRIEAKNRTIRLLDSDADWDVSACGFNFAKKSAVSERSRTEIWIKRGRNFRSDYLQTDICHWRREGSLRIARRAIANTTTGPWPFMFALILIYSDDRERSVKHG